MTCIVGLIHRDVIYMGGDSAATSNWDLKIRQDPKVFIKKEFILGFTTSFRMGQLLMSSRFNPPEQKNKQSDLDYMITDFVDHIREIFQSSGFLKKKENADVGGKFLVGYRKNLYTIHQDFQVAWARAAYEACGGGQQAALGALYATEGMRMAPKRRVELALKAAEELTASVRGPFLIRQKSFH